MKLYFLLIVFFHFSILSIAQNVPIVDTASLWSILFEYDNNQDQWQERQIYTIKYDTVINDVEYKKLLKNNEYFGAIRENETQQVYIIGLQGHYTYCFSPIIDTIEYLLYDFSLDINDTMKVTDNFFYVVNNIDSVMIDNNYRKRIYFDDGRGISDTWIEGIGSIDGILNPFQCVFEWYWILKCFENKGKSLYPYSSEEKCEEIIISNFNEELNINKISIYPNPFRNTLNLEFKSLLGYKRVLIRDIYGTIITELNTDKNQITINDLLNSGIYILQIYHEENTITKTICKIE